MMNEGGWAGPRSLFFAHSPPSSLTSALVKVLGTWPRSPSMTPLPVARRATTAAKSQDRTARNRPVAPFSLCSVVAAVAAAAADGGAGPEPADAPRPRRGAVPAFGVDRTMSVTVLVCLPRPASDAAHRVLTAGGGGDG